jgi:hypothetical protein
MEYGKGSLAPLLQPVRSDRDLARDLLDRLTHSSRRTTSRLRATEHAREGALHRWIGLRHIVPVLAGGFVRFVFISFIGLPFG